MCLKSYPMKYVSPIFGKTLVTYVPCGKCIECVADRQNSWKIRLLHEMSQWPNIWFFTLTYSDDTVPYNIDDETGFIGTTARKTDVQAWIKRMRMRFYREHGEKLRMKYFICAEYGPEGEYIDYAGRPRQSTCRPHYHGIIMTDVKCSDIIPFFREWSSVYGIVDYSQVEHTSRESRSKSSNYVAKYCCKGEFSSRFWDIVDGLIEPAWSLMSKGIGQFFVDEFRSQFVPYDFPDTHYTEDEMLDMYCKTQDSEIWKQIAHICEEAFIDDGGHKYKMPKYYKDRFYGTPYYSERIVPDRGYSLQLLGENFAYKNYFVQNPTLFPSITFKTKVLKVRRYVHSNFLSMAMRTHLLVQSCMDDFRAWKAERERVKGLSYVRFLEQRHRDKQAASEAREQALRAKMRNFYFSNAEKYKALNYA